MGVVNLPSILPPTHTCPEEARRFLDAIPAPMVELGPWSLGQWANEPPMGQKVLWDDHLSHP